MTSRSIRFSGKPIAAKSVSLVLLKVMLFTLLALFTILALFPFVWMVSSSLKVSTDVFRYPIEWIPAVKHWDNYVTIWQRVPLLIYFKNTAILSVAVTFLQVLTSSFAAYAFAKMTFRGRDFLFLCYIGTIAIPWQTYMLPQFILMRQVGLYDTLMALVVLQSFTAFGVFLMRQFFLSIPNELSEAARIDGLSEYGIWGRIIVPLSKPAIATLSIFTFVATWNDYMGPLIYLRSDSVKTIQVGLRRFIQQYTTEFNLIMAASLCSIVPMIVVFMFLQKYFVEGIANTGIKG